MADTGAYLTVERVLLAECYDVIGDDLQRSRAVWHSHQIEKMEALRSRLASALWEEEPRG